MYCSYYDLKERPFQISPDPKFLWLGEKHNEALSTLKYGILSNVSFVLLTGDVGTGKTTLIHALVNSLGEDVIVATISDPGLEKLDFFNMVSHAFGLNARFVGKGDFLAAFTAFLYQANSQDKKVLLLIDESQRLNHELLEEIRMLSNIEKQDRKLLNIFFVGQKEFNDVLLSDENRALRQRITINYNIDPLTEKETGEYIRYRVKVAGSEKPIFNSRAIREVFLFSRGYPRLINIICDHALLTGYAKYLKTINAGVIKECADELQIKPRNPGDQEDIRKIEQSHEFETRGKRFGGLLFYMILFAMMLILIGYLFYKGEYGRYLTDVIKYHKQDSNALIDPGSGNNAGKTQVNDPPLSGVYDKEDPAGAILPARKVRVKIDRVPGPEEKKTSTTGSSKEAQRGEAFVEKSDSHNILESQLPPAADWATVSPADAEVSETPKNEVGSKEVFSPENRGEDAGATGIEERPPNRRLTVHFERNSSEMSPEAYKRLDRMAAFVRQNPDTAVIIKGYSDSRGASNYNVRITEFRANMVKTYFVAKGCDPAKIKTFGMGSIDPIAPNTTSEGRQLNRRVEIELMGGRGDEIEGRQTKTGP